MFCDMVGSSALSTRLDPEEQRDIVSAFQACCANEVKRLGGMVAQYLGDGVLAFFGYPVAHEDDAERAVRGGLAILHAVGMLKLASSVTLQARIGISTGVVVVGDLVCEGVTQENAAIGETTNLAARLQTLAEPNTIVISSETHRLVGALFEYRDLGHVSAKGFADGVHARQVIGASKVESRFEARHQGANSPLLGREEDLDLLLRRWEQAKRGEGRVVLLTGEAGIGKSRLTRVLQERLTREPHTRSIYHCSPYHQDSALHPIIEQLQRAASIDRMDNAETKLDKLETLLSQSSENLAEDMPLFAALLSVRGGYRYPLPNLTPQRLRERTLAALLAHLKRLAARQPVLMVFEDLHWIDPTSLELLSLVVDQVRGQPLLLLATSRPEFIPPWPSHRHISNVVLTRLDRKEGEALVAGVTGGKSLPPEVLDQIVARTDGVPLFIEELTKTVLESGLLREADDHYELAGPLPLLAIPSSLHASLLARLDRLASAKDVAQIGAAIGREFSYALIAAVSSLPVNDLHTAITQLVNAELIFQRGTPPAAQYIFKHALLQDAAYASLVRSRRTQFHAQIARALEERFPDVLANQPEMLAHHLTEAGFIDRAIDYWREAGKHALSRSANIEAIKHLTRAIKLNSLLPHSAERDRKELAINLTLGPAFMSIRGYAAPETEQVFSRARDLLGSSEDPVEQMTVLNGLWMLRIGRREFTIALGIAQQMLAIATRHEHATALAYANRCMGQTLWIMGALEGARQHFQRTLDLLAAAGGTLTSLAPGIGNDHAVALSGLARTLWLLGYSDQAAARARDAVACARAIGNASAISAAISMFWQGVLAGYGPDAERAATHIEETLIHCVAHNFTDWEHQARFQQGALIARKNNPHRGIEIMRAATAEAERMGMYRTLHFGQLAAAHASLGQNEVALSLVGEAIQEADKTSERAFEAELHRLHGDLLLKLGKKSEGENILQRALTVARQQQARFLELRAATTLAQHWHDEGRHVDARYLLEPVYAWFTEGFDTPDLRNARALLGQLNE
jgi:class 3 adenylate cyclase/tetratricopeptide (TPR) repeat protein